MKLKRLGRINKAKVAVGILVLLAVVGGAYLAFADDEPVEISNAEELEQVREDLDGHYVLVDDIDLSHIDNFEPIGSRSEPFTGRFDGNEHSISNLTIDRSEEELVGLFGYVGRVGSVESVGLEEVYVTGNTDVGSIAGANGGIVHESYATGKVRGSVNVGGLVGENVRTPGGGRDIASGIGMSYATANVSGEKNVGGLVGVNDDFVVQSYAAGNVTGDEDVGGLVGLGVARDSYWDVNTTGQDNSAGGTGLTTDEMTGSAARENMDGFDFGETWRTTEDDYPILAWQTADETGSDTQT